MQTTYESPSTVESARAAIKKLPSLAASPYVRLMMSLWLMLADLLALLLAGGLAIQARMLLGKQLTLETYAELLPAVVVFILGYLLVGLYPGVGLNPIQEMKQVTLASCTIMSFLAGVFFLTQTGLRYSRGAFLLFWVFLLVIVPLARMAARKIGVVYKFWGEPVALIGFGPQGRHIYQYLKNNPMYGIRPVVVVNGLDEAVGEGEYPEILQVGIHHLVHDRCLLRQAGIRTAIIAPTEIPEDMRKALVDEQEFGLDRLILISSLNWIGDAAVVPHDLGGILGLEVERNLLHASKQVVKKMLDMCIMVTLGLVCFPFILICAILIRLDTCGPAFFKQYRVGKDGKSFWVWKFRTMVDDADDTLEKYLQANPQLRAEWLAIHKLKHDPRITRIGRILRKTSLDELPQLINVLRGEMSVVGPRPIMQDEVRLYKEGYKLYTQVQPGITGLWQVSGRSDTSYAGRVALDEYYIRHWSIYMDIYILVRTLWVVIKRSGAY